MGLTQKEVAARIGVTSFTVLNWEKHYIDTIPVKVMPAIIALLGYDPFPKPETIGEMLRAYRRVRGWSIRELAEHLGVDEATVSGWEGGKTVPFRKHKVLLTAILTNP